MHAGGRAIISAVTNVYKQGERTETRVAIAADLGLLRANLVSARLSQLSLSVHCAIAGPVDAAIVTGRVS